MKVNKRNLKRVWKQLDQADGALYNALDNLASLEGSSDRVKRLSDMIDVSRVTMLKNEIEALVNELGGDVNK